MEETFFEIKKDEKEAVIRKVFDAPRELVWRVWTDPDLVPQWWGPRNLETRVETMDLRTGGRWKFLQKDPSGKEYAFNGVYRQVSPQEKVIQTFEFEGSPGHIMLETIIFEDIEGKTQITDISSYETENDLEEMLKSGMEKGAKETMERFENLLNKILQTT